MNDAVAGSLLSFMMGCTVCCAAPSDALYQEQYRPQYHFSPPQQWMNDPNGMVYHNGEYQLFYQYNPYANQWGPMHWGHAVSADLVHWENLPIALFPDRHGTIFSGSAVIDAGNSSGFGSKDNPPMVAVFTYDDQLSANLGRSDIQSEGVAYSLDEGRNWVKYSDNPVLANPGIRDFRDPKVFWYAPGRVWVMTLAVHDHVAFYSSPDLKHWTHESDFGKGLGAHSGVWECPDLIEVAVAGPTAHEWVLLVSVNPGGPNGGSGTQYFVGSFDGHEFTAEAPALAGDQAALWLDYGTDDYAGSTWSGGAHGDPRQLFIGWMSNWQYANLVPTQRWRSALTIPRELQLAMTPEGARLRSLPVAELAALRRRTVAIAARTVTSALDLTGAAGTASDLLELQLKVKTQRATTIEMVFSNAQGQHTSFRINRSEHRYEVDRSASGAVDFGPSFGAPQFAPLKGSADRVAVHAFLDHSSLEIFINEGETVFTTVVFPAIPYDKISLTADRKIALDAGTLYELGSIWTH